MFQYLKSRFQEYMSYCSEEHKDTPKSIHTSHQDPYVDFEILYGGTDIIVDCFSMSKQGIKQNFSNALLKNLSEVLDVHKDNIKIIAKDDEKTLCDITYSGKPNEYIRHEIREMKKSSFKYEVTEADIYNDLDDESYNPYEDGGWGDMPWYCIRCGFKLIPIAKNNKEWGDITWNEMQRNGTQWYLCANKECFHHNGPLILHHPTNWQRGAGDSYSISWVK